MEYSETKIEELAKASASRYALLNQNGVVAKCSPHEFAMMANRLLSSFVSFMNNNAGVRRRKHIDRLAQVLEVRGLNCRIIPAEGRETFTVGFDNCSFIVERLCGKGMHVMLNDIRYRGARVAVAFGYIHLAAAEEDIADMLEMFDRFVSSCNEVIVAEEGRMMRQYVVSQIEMPLLESIVSDFMKNHGIRNYDLFIGRQGEVVLEVQIFKEHWMGNDSVCVDNIESILGIIPYLLKRPGRIKEDGMGFIEITKW